MKHMTILALMMALLVMLPAARAESAPAWETAEDIFMVQLNDDIRRNDSSAHLYTGSDIIPGLYQAFTCPDGCFAMVYADDSESDITGIDIFCEDAACVRRRLDDVAYLGYCFGSRDSIEAISGWCDQWCDAVCDALNDEKPMESDTCDCAAFIAKMSVYQNDAEVWILRIHIAL